MMERVAFALISGFVASLVPATAQATELSDLAASLEPGDWGQLQTEGLLEVISEQNGGATSSIFPFAEDGVWDPATGQFFFIGSDHIYDGESSGPRFVAYGDDTNVWTVVQDPIPWWSSGTMHGYDHSAMLEGGLYHMALIEGMSMQRYDTVLQTWEERAESPLPGYNRFGGLEPFPEVGGLVYVERGGIAAYDNEADSWTIVDEGIAMGDYHNFAEYNPVHGVVLFGGGNGSGAMYTVDEDLVITPRGDAPFPLRVNEAIVTADPNSGDFLLFGGAGEFLTYDVVEDALLVQDVEVPIFGDPSEPLRLTIAGPIDSYGVIMFVRHIGIGLGGSAEVWLYRHAPGMGEPPGEPPGGESSSSGGDDSDTGDDPTTGSQEDGSASGSASASGDSGPSTASGSDDGSSGSAGADESEPQGCGCRVRSDGPGLALLLGLFALGWRRR